MSSERAIVGAVLWLLARCGIEKQHALHCKWVMNIVKDLIPGIGDC